MNDEDLVKELIGVVIEKRTIEAREKELKYKVLDFIHKHGKFESDLGTVSPSEHQERFTFDRDKLEHKLENEFGLSGPRLEQFLNDCKTPKDIMPGVTVRIKNVQ